MVLWVNNMPQKVVNMWRIHILDNGYKEVEKIQFHVAYKGYIKIMFWFAIQRWKEY